MEVSVQDLKVMMAKVEKALESDLGPADRLQFEAQLLTIKSQIDEREVVEEAAQPETLPEAEASVPEQMPEEAHEAPTEEPASEVATEEVATEEVPEAPTPEEVTPVESVPTEEAAPEVPAPVDHAEEMPLPEAPAEPGLPQPVPAELKAQWPTDDEILLAAQTGGDLLAMMDQQVQDVYAAKKMGS